MKRLPSSAAVVGREALVCLCRACVNIVQYIASETLGIKERGVRH